MIDIYDIGKVQPISRIIEVKRVFILSKRQSPLLINVILKQPTILSYIFLLIITLNCSPYTLFASTDDKYKQDNIPAAKNGGYHIKN